jgi:hypothetical protein
MANTKTGPVTIPGKKISSRNAVKHGATSKGFINEQEKDRFDLLLSDLNKHYESNNPLIRLQLERIARVTIQLERIQNTIDALFEKSRADSRLESNLLEYLEISPGQRIKALLNKLGSGGIANESEEEVSKEVIALKLSPASTQQEFLEKAPTLFAQLYQSAALNEESFKEYIEDKINANTNQSGYPNIRVVYVDNTDTINKNESQFEPLEDAILDIPLSDLKKLVDLKFTDIQAKKMELKKLEDFDKLLPIEEQATTPDLDQLDKLMRYQTTLQRQLSTTIGELIALTKANPM